MASRYYILNLTDDPIQATLLEWGRWMDRADRVVAKNQTPKGVEISTVFLGLNHALRDTDPPQIYETMIFGGSLSDWCARTATRDEALKEHHRAMELALEAEASDEPA